MSGTIGLPLKKGTGLSFLLVLITSAFAQGLVRGDDIPWISHIISKGMLNYIPHGVDGLNLCTQDGQTLAEHALNLTMWAVRMIDASSKGPSGLVYGNNYDFGHYDECLSTHVSFLNITGRFMIINLKYWPKEENNIFWEGPSTNFNFPEELDSAWSLIQETKDARIRQRNQVNWAVCVPSSCGPSDIQFSVNNVLKPLLNQHNLDANISVIHYQTKSDIHITLSFLLFVMCLSVIAVLVCIATAIEYILLNGNGKVNELKVWNFLLHFSVLSNMPVLMNPKSQEFSIISGMKVLTMILIIFGHRLMVTSASPIFNTYDNEIAIGKFFNTILDNGAIVVNTYLVITGFLTYYKILKDINNGRSINIFKMIMRRWLRLTPAYLFCLGIIILVIPRLEEGPLAFDQLWNNTACAKHWWTHVLYLNNYLHPETQCILPSWYLAVDMQLYVVCTIIGYITWRNKCHANKCLIFLFIASVIIPGGITYLNHYDGTTFIYLKDLKALYSEKQFIETYIPTHTRATSYLVGMIGAIAYMKIKLSKNFNIPKWILAVITLMMLATMLFTVMAAWVLYGSEYKVLLHTIYAATHKVTWSIPIAWLIIIYSTNKISIFKGLLGNNIYYPFNQMSYCVLLIHNHIQLYMAGALRSPVFYNSVSMIWMAAGDITISYICALLLYLFIEAPFSNLLIKTV